MVVSHVFFLQQLAINTDLPASDDDDCTLMDDTTDDALPALAWVRIQECSLDSLNGSFAIVLPPGYRNTRVLEGTTMVAVDVDDCTCMPTRCLVQVDPLTVPEATATRLLASQRLIAQASAAALPH